jgi:hypothetical protein
MISLDPAPAAAAQSIDLSRATVNLPWMAGVGALVLAALFLLLYAYRRRLYISEWMLGWLCLAAALFLLSRDFASARATDAAIGVAQFLVICGGLLFVVSVDSFRQRPHVHRLYFVGLLPLFIWFALAPIALGSWSALVPGHLIAAGVLAAAGVGYLALVRQTKLLGAGVVGASFLLVAALNVWLSLAFSGLSASSSMQLLAGMALLYILAGFGMHLMVFEDMTCAAPTATSSPPRPTSGSSSSPTPSRAVTTAASSTKSSAGRSSAAGAIACPSRCSSSTSIGSRS